MLAPALPWALSLSTSRASPGHKAVAESLVEAEHGIARWSWVCADDGDGSASRQWVAVTVLPEPHQEGCADWGLSKASGSVPNGIWVQGSC